MSANNNHQKLLNSWSAKLAESVPACSRPPETVKPALVALDGGIPFYISKIQYLETLDSIKTRLINLNKSCFDKSLLSDDEHYNLLEIEYLFDELLTGQKIIERD